MEIFVHHYGIFGAFPAGFRPAATRVKDREGDDPRCLRNACQRAVSERLQDAK
jgi:hypothetical protein